MHFATLVRQQMKTKRMSIRRVCRIAEVDPSFFAKVLRGERNPPDEEKVLARIAEALDVEPLALVLSVGRLPADWLTQAQRPEVRRALEGLFRPVRAAAPPPRPRREEALPAAPPAAPLPRRRAPEPRASANELSEDLL